MKKQRISKPLYTVCSWDFIWVLEMKLKQKALRIWEKRFWLLFDYQLNSGMLLYSKEWDQIDKICEELYERCVALRYPTCLSSFPPWYQKVVDERADLESYINECPKGSMIARKDGKAIACFFNKYSPSYIGPDVYKNNIFNEPID